MHYIKNGKVICGATHVRGKWTDIESHVTCDDCFDALDLTEKHEIRLEDHTFGSSPAEVSLARILNEINDRRLASRAGGLVNRFDLIIKEINCIETPSVKRYLLDVSRRDFFSSVDNLNASEKVKTYIKNVLTIRYRKICNSK